MRLRNLIVALLIVFVGTAGVFAGQRKFSEGWLDWSKSGIIQAPSPATSGQIIEEIKTNMIYFRKDGRCYAAVTFSTHLGFGVASITQINCTDDIK